MKYKLKLALMALVLMACSKEEASLNSNHDCSCDEGGSTGEIVLGERLANPYTTKNISEALNSLYPTKSGDVNVRTTHLYVRFLPKSQQEYEELSALGLRMLDYPMDYDIKVHGDWYHDPEIPQDQITWQYTVVPVDFKFPGIEYEIIDECHIPDDDTDTKGGDSLDWDAIERQAYMNTGNEGMLAPQTKASAVRPMGRITISDKHYNGGQGIGLSGVLISCNSFVKMDDTYTDEFGYYEMSKKFTANLTYKVIFDNKEDFSIGFNLILSPASSHFLDITSPSGCSVNISRESNQILFNRCVVNNAAYDYIKLCEKDNMISPPSDLRIWVLHNLKWSGAIMARQGALLENNLFKTFMGEYAGLIRVFLPDVVVGLKNEDTYQDIYSSVCHEISHSSHFSKAKVDWWNKYLKYRIKSLTSSNKYGSGKEEGAGNCEVAEMWAYYMQSLMYKNRYGGNFQAFGKGYWFKPDILRDLHKNGFKSNEILSVLDSNVSSKSDFKQALITKYPSRKTKIEQAFDKY